MPGRMRWSSLLVCSLVGTMLGCATTVRQDDSPEDDAALKADGTPGFIDAMPRPDAMPHPDAHPGTPDAAGIPDASPQSTIDAATGPFCTVDSQCNQGAHECCWLLLGSSGVCTYGDVVIIFGCVPSSPDAAPPP